MSGLVEIAGGAPASLSLIQGTIAAGMTATIVILAMSLGLIVPKMIIDHVANRSMQRAITGAAEHVGAR
jgi:hypothetical protein